MEKILFTNILIALSLVLTPVSAMEEACPDTATVERQALCQNAAAHAHDLTLSLRAARMICKARADRAPLDVSAPEKIIAHLEKARDALLHINNELAFMGYEHSTVLEALTILDTRIKEVAEVAGLVANHYLFQLMDHVVQYKESVFEIVAYHGDRAQCYAQIGGAVDPAILSAATRAGNYLDAKAEWCATHPGQKYLKFLRFLIKPPVSPDIVRTAEACAGDSNVIQRRITRPLFERVAPDIVQDMDAARRNGVAVSQLMRNTEEWLRSQDLLWARRPAALMIGALQATALGTTYGLGLLCRCSSWACNKVAQPAARAVERNRTAQMFALYAQALFGSDASELSPMAEKYMRKIRCGEPHEPAINPDYVAVLKQHKLEDEQEAERKRLAPYVAKREETRLWHEALKEADQKRTSYRKLQGFALLSVPLKEDDRDIFYDAPEPPHDVFYDASDAPFDTELDCRIAPEDYQKIF